MAGGGEVIPNGSIHWNINHDNGSSGPYKQYFVSGVDPTPVEDVRKYEPDFPGLFKVVLQWNSVAEAQAALSTALERGVSGGIAIFYITPNPVSSTQAIGTPGTPNPYAQIRVDW
jgi:hypothetical protein